MFSCHSRFFSIALFEIMKVRPYHWLSRSHCSSKHVLSHFTWKTSSHIDDSDAQTTWSWDSGKLEESSSMERPALAACYCGPCSPFCIDIIDSPSSPIRKRQFYLSFWATFSTPSASFDASCDSRVHVLLLMVFDVAFSVPGRTSKAGRWNNGDTLSTARRMGSSTDARS